VADAKGGLVVMVASLLALDALGLPTPPIRIVLSGDEQAGSLGSRAAIRAEAGACRTCFCLECARDGGKLMAARAHIGVGRVDATGRASHAGTAHATGVNAIDALITLLPRLTRFSDTEAKVFVSATKIEGGRRRSVIPARASAILDVRTPDAAAWNLLAARLHDETKKASLGSAAILDLHLEAHRPGVSWSRNTSTLLTLVQEAASGIGLEVEATTSSAAGSSAFAAEAGAVVLDGMGPSGGDLMTPDEFVDVGSVVPRAAVLAESIRRLAVEGLGDPDDGDVRR
jgi:glutamate carboxypeptidase